MEFRGGSAAEEGEPSAPPAERFRQGVRELLEGEASVQAAGEFGVCTDGLTKGALADDSIRDRAGDERRIARLVDLAESLNGLEERGKVFAVGRGRAAS